jgi:uncharacterized protein (DUF58 family)
VQRILRDLYYFKPKSRGTKLESGFRFLQGLLKKKAAIFVISDFMDQGYDSSLRMLGKKHDVTALVIEDPLEKNLPDLGVIEMCDAETGEIITVDTSSQSFRENLNKEVGRRNLLRDRLLRQSQVERVDIVSSNDFYNPLVQYFRKRKLRG